MNVWILSGTVAETPERRTTSGGVELCELIVAAKFRDDREADLVPITLWREDAVRASMLAPGTAVEMHGRLSGREYNDRYYLSERVTGFAVLGAPAAPAPPPPPESSAPQQGADEPPQDDIPF